MSQPFKETYLGTGKLEELLTLKESLKYDLVIVDDELSPVQQRYLEDYLKVKVVDRVALILDVFARRAMTREGRLQVELAQSEYLLPRLAGRWAHLERLGGGIGIRGPGESQLETDRRLVRRKIQNLRREIEEVRKQRALYRERRRKSGVPVVALVGYTNSGKSTLLNALSHAGVLVEDRLFSTLDPTTRRVALSDNRVVLFTDTVGFIRKLPPQIVDAFRATLEELEDAGLLVHVVDITLHNAAEQCQIVEDILKDLNLQSKPRITALNKIDKLIGGDTEPDETETMDYLKGLEEFPESVRQNTVIISAVKKWGLDKLLELVGRLLLKKAQVAINK